MNVSSIGAQVTPVGSGYYAAAKAALEGLSGALRGELAPLGISVTIIEPGAFRTDSAGRSLTPSATAIDNYADTAGKRRKEHDTVPGTQAGDPDKAAIIEAVEADTPPVEPAGGGFPAITLLAEFLLKDVVLLGASFWTLADAIRSGWLRTESR